MTTQLDRPALLALNAAVARGTSPHELEGRSLPLNIGLAATWPQHRDLADVTRAQLAHAGLTPEEVPYLHVIG